MAEQLDFRDQDGRRRIRLVGRWTMDGVDELARAIGPASAGAPAAVEIEASGVESLDLTGKRIAIEKNGEIIPVEVK